MTTQEKSPGIDRYRAVLAHIVGHRRWSEAQIADNWSPFQRMAVEFFEDCRIETLLIREYPGLRRLFLALHPHPLEDACDPETTSCLRHRMAMLSRALLDPHHGYADTDLNDFVARFRAVMDKGESSTSEIAALALSYVAKTRRQSDQLARIHFADTVVEYRDDNRQMWKFIESGDEEEAFDEKRKIEPGQEIHGLPPRHYPEWDYSSQTYRPDWVSVYGSLHPSGNAGRHRPPARQTQRARQAAEEDARPVEAAGQGAHPLPGRGQRTRSRRRDPFADRLQGRRHPRPAHQHEPHAPPAATSR